MWCYGIFILRNSLRIKIPCGPHCGAMVSIKIPCGPHCGARVSIKMVVWYLR